MTRASSTYTEGAASSSQFKLMALPVSSALNSVLTKTSDSGQVNWATTTTFPTLAASTLYEVFGFSDSLQTSKPVIFRVLYGYDGIGLTIGTGSNGAGTLTGTAQANGGSTTFYTVVSPGASGRYLYASSDGSYLTFLMNVQAASATVPDGLAAVVVERTRDADGTPNGDGLCIWRWGPASVDVAPGAFPYNFYTGYYGRSFDVTATQPTATLDYNVTAPNITTLSSWSNGANSYAFPCYGSMGNQLYGASKALMIGASSDFNRVTPYTINHYATPMQFLAMGTGQGALLPFMSAASTTNYRGTFAPLFRWE